jgi:hypothetical protein
MRSVATHIQRSFYRMISSTLMDSLVGGLGTRDANGRMQGPGRLLGALLPKPATAAGTAAGGTSSGGDASAGASNLFGKLIDDARKAIGGAVDGIAAALSGVGKALTGAVAGIANLTGNFLIGLGGALRGPRTRHRVGRLRRRGLGRQDGGRTVRRRRRAFRAAGRLGILFGGPAVHL